MGTDDRNEEKPEKKKQTDINYQEKSVKGKETLLFARNSDPGSNP